MNLKKRFSVLALTASVLLTGCSHTSGTNASVSKTGFCLDTVVSLTLYGTKDDLCSAAPEKEAISGRSITAVVPRSLSRKRPHS